MEMTGENRSTGGETCHSATLSITNPTWTDPGYKERCLCNVSRFRPHVLLITSVLG